MRNGQEKNGTKPTGVLPPGHNGDIFRRIRIIRARLEIVLIAIGDIAGAPRRQHGGARNDSLSPEEVSDDKGGAIVTVPRLNFRFE
jgi:hypothetical protein